MKLSTNTMSILKNFATINEGIFVKPGNVIETISKQKNILAKAELTDTFDTEFGIHDLNNFLGTLTLARDAQPERILLSKALVVVLAPSIVKRLKKLFLFRLIRLSPWTMQRLNSHLTHKTLSGFLKLHQHLALQTLHSFLTVNLVQSKLLMQKMMHHMSTQQH